MTVAIVTDSTSALPLAAAGSSDLIPLSAVTVVPLSVVIDGTEGREGVEITCAEVARALADRRVKITTSRPAPADFATAYRAAFAAGASEVVSVHLSAALSGTIEAARAAAAEADGPVEVIDSRSTGMGLGFAVLAAAEAAQAGRSLTAVCRIARETAAATEVFFSVESLDHLRRGGRIGAASTIVGTALSVKPILHVVDGAIVAGDRVRTTGRALDRLAELAVAAALDADVDIAVHHLGMPERAAYLVDTLKGSLGERIRQLHVTEISATVAVHVGPGVAGVVIHRRSA